MPRICQTEAAVTGFTAFTCFRVTVHENCLPVRRGARREFREIVGRKVEKAVKAVSLRPRVSAMRRCKFLLQEGRLALAFRRARQHRRHRQLDAFAHDVPPGHLTDLLSDGIQCRGALRFQQSRRSDRAVQHDIEQRFW